MTELWRTLRDPKVSIALALATLCAGGLLFVAVGWRGVAATVVIPFQIPYLASGGFLGVALLGTGLGLLVAHVNRAEAAVERERYAALQREALGLLSMVTEGGALRAGRQ